MLYDGIADAKLVGLNNVLLGWYSSTFPLMVYALLGCSSQLALGPVGPVAILINSSVKSNSDLSPSDVAIALAFMSGIVQLLFALLGFGFVANLLSWPVMSGYTSAAAFIIAVSQLSDFFAIKCKPALHSFGAYCVTRFVVRFYCCSYHAASHGSFFEELFHFFKNFPDIHWPVAGIGLVSLAILLGVKMVKINGRKLPPWFPTQLLLVIVATVISLAGNFPDTGYTVEASLGNLNGTSSVSFPTPSFPEFSIMNSLITDSIILALVAYVCSMSLAIVFGKKVGETINANIELMATGTACVVSSLFSGFTIGGSFSRTTINNELGAKTPLAGFFTAVILLIVALVNPIEDFIKHLPNAVLAAMIIASVKSLVKYEDAIKLWKSDFADFFQMFATFWLTLVFGVANGIIYSVAVALAVLILKSFRPQIVELTRFPGTDVFVEKSRFPETEAIDGVLIIRVNGPLHFGNSSVLTSRLLKILSKTEKLRKRLRRGSSLRDDEENLLDDNRLQMSKEKLLTREHGEDLQMKRFGHLTSGEVEDILEKNAIEPSHTNRRRTTSSFHLPEPEEAEERYKNLRAVIIDGSRIVDIDAHAAAELEDAVQLINKSKTGRFAVLLASFSMEARNLFRQLQLEALNSSIVYLTVASAVHYVITSENELEGTGISQHIEEEPTKSSQPEAQTSRRITIPQKRHLFERQASSVISSLDRASLRSSSIKGSEFH